MFGLGFSEIMVLAVLGLLLLGPEQLPDMARTLGRFINDLKRSTDGLKEEFNKQGGFADGQKLLEEIRKETRIEEPSFEDHIRSSEPPAQDPATQAIPSPESNSTEVKEDEHGKKPESH